MSNKAAVSLSTGLEDPEKVTVALLVAVGTACDGCPSIPSLLERLRAAGGELLVCPLCFNAKALDTATLLDGATMGGTVQLWQWIGPEAATAFSY